MDTPSTGKRRFARIERLPPYVFGITSELKLAARRRGEDSGGQLHESRLQSMK